MHGTATIEVGRDDVEAPRAGKVVHDDAAGGRDDVEASLRGHVAEASDVFARFEGGGWNDVRGWNLVRVAAQRHVREIEQPTHLEVVGLLLQETQEVFDG